MNCVTEPCLMMIISSWPSWRWNAWPSPGSSVTSMTTSDFAPVFAGRQRQPIVPQSKPSCSTSACVTNLLITLLPGQASACPCALDGNCLEAAHVLGHRDLCREALHRGGAEEPDHALRARDHVGRVVRLGDRAAVAQHEDVRPLT